MQILLNGSTNREALYRLVTAALKGNPCPQGSRCHTVKIVGCEALAALGIAPADDPRDRNKGVVEVTIARTAYYRSLFPETDLASNVDLVVFGAKQLPAQG